MVYGHWRRHIFGTNETSCFMQSWDIYSGRAAATATNYTLMFGYFWCVLKQDSLCCLQKGLKDMLKNSKVISAAFVSEFVPERIAIRKIKKVAVQSTKHELVLHYTIILWKWQSWQVWKIESLLLIPNFASDLNFFQSNVLMHKKQSWTDPVLHSIRLIGSGHGLQVVNLEKCILLNWQVKIASYCLTRLILKRNQSSWHSVGGCAWWDAFKMNPTSDWLNCSITKSGIYRQQSLPYLQITTIYWICTLSSKH